ncbi:uncharacterized protein LOC126836721 [Adelges cooleyi]|uniref:uncharacterized protein LOC126836721 n=1 Tax=Adelges cooleyi TaxID=133065 RepID=UPI00217F9392|nr:uncharacterized protein LOC126836721 [Adelges cooleyi]
MHLQWVILVLASTVWYGVTRISCASKGDTSLTPDDRIQLVQEYNRLLRIETGYPLGPQDYGAGRYSQLLVTNIRRSRLNDLKCSYLSSVLVHMSRTGIMLVVCSDTAEVIKTINQYSGTAQKQLATLYELGFEDTDLLWRFYFYTKLVNSFPDCVSSDGHSNDAESLQWLMTVHDAILTQIKTTVAECRPGGEFDPTNYDVDPAIIYNLDALMTDVLNNITNINALLLRNNQDIVTWGSAAYMSLTNLYLNDFGSHRNVDYMMIAFNVQVVWNNVRGTLHRALANARRMDWLTTSGMAVLVGYHTLCIQFVKFIMLRLTLKHLMYLNQKVLSNLNPAVPAVPRRANEKVYVTEWQNILNEFALILDLTDDSLFNVLVDSFDGVHVYNKTENNGIFNILMTAIDNLSLLLGCDAMEPMILDGKEFFYTYNTQKARDNPTENYSIKSAQSFVKLVRDSFKNVSFKIITMIGKQIET